MNKHLSPAASAGGNRDLIAVRAAMKILDKWGCTPEQQQNTLQLSKATSTGIGTKEQKAPL